LVCEAIESRGTACWIATRDVAPGENYQEAIVHAIRGARALVLIFSEAANTSDEIKKELSVASRYHVPVLALRIAQVEPSDAFLYELSTRQWIDAFEDWDKSIDLLVDRIGQLCGGELVSGISPAPPRRLAPPSSRNWTLIAICGSLLLLFMAAGAWWLRTGPKPEHSMSVRLAGFQPLSTDLPPTIPASVEAEIAAAFNADGVVGVSTAKAPPPGPAPAYALGGTIQRDGEKIRVITRLTNERSGATLWSDTFNYDGNEVGRVPRHVAVDAGNVVRCGLFGASTYRKPLPDAVLKDYMQFCQGHWDPNIDDGRKALVPAQRVVAAAPDFSWGWAAVAGGFWKVALTSDDSQAAERAQENGRQAADRALAIDGKNSEALWIKALLLDQYDWIGREGLFKRAVAARSLDCGCEHHQYGEMLLSVGRVTDAVDQMRQANDMLALYVYTPLSLARGLVAAGKSDEARSQFDAAVDLAPNSDFAKSIAVMKAMEIGDIKSLADPKLPIGPDQRSALLNAYHAIASKDEELAAQAKHLLLALPQDQQGPVIPKLLAQLGDDRAAFQLARRLVFEHRAGPSIFWDRKMRGTLSDPGFPRLATQLGLMTYWKATHAKPDACVEPTPPPFCRVI
jgi:tetratricopeptide (TPR) repeat protein